MYDSVCKLDVRMFGPAHSDGRVDLLTPPEGSSPGDKVFVEAYDKLGGEAVIC